MKNIIVKFLALVCLVLGAFWLLGIFAPGLQVAIRWWVGIPALLIGFTCVIAAIKGTTPIKWLRKLRKPSTSTSASSSNADDILDAIEAAGFTLEMVEEGGVIPVPSKVFLSPGMAWTLDTKVLVGGIKVYCVKPAPMLDPTKLPAGKKVGPLNTVIDAPIAPVTPATAPSATVDSVALEGLKAAFMQQGQDPVTATKSALAVLGVHVT